MKLYFRRLWNGVRWGSAEGPEIVIDWDKRSITFLRCSGRMTTRMLRRITQIL